MVRTLQRLADVVLYVALALGIAGALSGCTSSERSVRINQYMYAVYTVLYGDGRPYYAVTFTDGSILAISSHPADRSECVMNIRSDFPAFKRAMKLKDIVMYRTDPIVKDSLMDFDYKTSLMSLYVQNCGNGGNCLAAKHASIEMARLITSQFFRDCCVNGHECRD
jgi:hypothetical protein